MNNNKDLPTNPNKMKFNQYDWITTHVNNFYKFAETKPTLEEALNTRIFAKYLINLEIDHGGGAGNLEFLSDRLKNDKKFVLFVVEKDGSALQYASEALRNDKEIVLEAIKTDESALQYASLQLKKEILGNQYIQETVVSKVVSKLTKFRDKCETLVSTKNSKNKM